MRGSTGWCCLSQDMHTKLRFGEQSGCRDNPIADSTTLLPPPGRWHCQAANQSHGPVLSSDYRDKRWALSLPCNTNMTIMLLQSAEWGVLHNLPCICEGTGLGTVSGRLQMPVHFSHTGPPSDSSLWYGDCLPGDKSPCTGSSGGERR